VVYAGDSLDTEHALGNDLRLRTPDGAEYEEGGYAVLELARENLADREYEINQKAAKLMAELNGKGQSGRSAVSFLQNTLQTYDTFRKLQRAHELQSRETLTDSEQRLLEDLQSNEKLKPYL